MTPPLETSEGGIPTAAAMTRLFLPQLKLDEEGQNVFWNLIGYERSEARREGYREAVLELLKTLIQLPKKDLTAEFLIELLENLGDPAAFKKYLDRRYEAERRDGASKTRRMRKS